MSLFDGKPINIQSKTKKIVLSASRMTDMPRFYPDELIEEVDKRLNKGVDIHTLVLWTKHPKALLEEPLYKYLLSLKALGVQLYIQLTITGLGGLKAGTRSNGKLIILEANTPKFNESLSVLPEVIKLVGNPERIRLRVDPIVRFIDARGILFSSLKYFPIIIDSASKLGIKDFSFSLLENNMHRKVDKRFKALGCTIVSATQEERNKLKNWLKELEQNYNVNIHACCVPGFDDTKCIDGELLQRLHSENAPVDLSEPRKRKKCGCTHSIDIGGWPPKECFSGCDYCYAHPRYAD